MAGDDLTNSPAALPQWASMWRYVLERWGFPTALACVLLYGLWDSGWRIARWAAPFAEQAATKHFQTMDSVVETGRMNAETNRRLAITVEELATEHKKTADQVDDIHRAVVKPGGGP